jgi:GNAT superfamily N-acetyltransferase
MANIRRANARKEEPDGVTARSLAAVDRCYCQVVDEASLARLEHENMLEWLRLTFGHVPGALIAADGGVGVFAAGLAHPFFNQIVVDDGASGSELSGAIEQVRGRGERFYVVLRHPQDAGFRELVAKLGLHDEEVLLPGMAVDPIAPAQPVPEELQIRVVRNVDDLADHATALSAYGLPGEIVRAFLGDEFWLLPETTTYVGYVGGEPVVSGHAVRTGRAIGVYSIATVDTARRRGYGAAMTERILADAVEASCDVAVLQASAMGRPIYERLGFRLVQEYEVFTG